MSWYYAKDGERVGPITEAALEDRVREGVVTPDTLVWREGMAEWRPWRDVSKAAGSVPPPPGVTGLANTCAECARQFGPEDLVEVMGGKVCAACKPARLQRIREGAPVIFGGESYADGAHVVVLRGGGLPGRCVACNAPSTGTVGRLFRWYPWWVNLLILPGLLFALIAMLIMRKQMRLEVPLCDEHRRQRRMRLVACGAWTVASLAAVPISWGWLTGLPGMAGEAMGFVAILSVLVSLWVGQSVAAILRPRRITADAGRFSGACKAFLESLPPWPGGTKS